MKRGQWNKPVTYETLTLGVYRTITSAEEADRVLLDEWPTDEGKAYTQAKAACLAALAGDGDAETARKAFLQAADEADVFIRD